MATSGKNTTGATCLIKFIYHHLIISIHPSISTSHKTRGEMDDFLKNSTNNPRNDLFGLTQENKNLIKVAIGM